jgi:hypothetical protein
MSSLLLHGCCDRMSVVMMAFAADGWARARSPSRSRHDAFLPKPTFVALVSAFFNDC